MSSTPVKGGTSDGTLLYFDISGRTRDTSINEITPNPSSGWEKQESLTNKYVDDVNVAEHHYIDQAVTSITTHKERKTIHATDCERVFEIIKANSSSIGMKVNVMGKPRFYA